MRRLPKGTAPAVRASNFLAIARIIGQENAKLAVLPRPVSELPNITFFLSKSRALIPLFGHAARAAAKYDKTAVTSALAAIRVVRTWRDYAARVLDARICTAAS